MGRELKFREIKQLALGHIAQSGMEKLNVNYIVRQLSFLSSKYIKENQLQSSELNI